MGGGETRIPEPSDAEMARHKQRMEEADPRDAELGERLTDILKFAVVIGLPVEVDDSVEELKDALPQRILLRAKSMPKNRIYESDGIVATACRRCGEHMCVCEPRAALGDEEMPTGEEPRGHSTSAERTPTNPPEKPRLVPLDLSSEEKRWRRPAEERLIGICRAVESPQHWFPADSTEDKCPVPDCGCTPAFFAPVDRSLAIDAAFADRIAALEVRELELVEERDQAIAERGTKETDLAECEQALAQAIAVSSEGKRWTLRQHGPLWDVKGPSLEREAKMRGSLREIEVVPASEVERLEQERHMAETKVVSQESIIEQLSETQLAKDVDAAERDLARLREAVESVRDKLQFPPTSTSLIPVPVAEVTEKLHALRNELNAALHPDEPKEG